MKAFVIKLSLFGVIISVCLYISGELLYYGINKYGKNFLNNADYKVMESIIRSRNHKKVKKLILGDSVSASLYGESEDSCVYSLSSTVALTTVGNYLLCSNFLKNNADQLPEEVILILNPLCWTNTMTGGLFYSTFTKNFFNDEFKCFLDKEEIDYLNEETFTFFCNQRWYQLSPYIPETHQVQESGKYISPIQYKYLMKLERICNEKHIKFRLLSGPVRQSLRHDIEEKLKGDTMCTTALFRKYFSSIQYWDDNNFVDQLHLKKESIPNDYFNLYK